jgi:AraC-like DNA-binding protein
MMKEGGHCTPVLKQVFLTPGQRSIVKRIEKLITKELSQRYNIEELAKKNGISPSTLKKLFAHTYGKPISIYLKEKRVEKAKQLLCETKWKIADIAAEVGYENQGKFGSVFRQATGVAPMEYRRLNRKETI